MMKKIIFLCLTVCVLQAQAATHIVSVSNFQFSPASLNVVVGDVVQWQWVSGFHTTASITVPTGAATWNSPNLSGAGQFYEYTVSEQGFYDYFCTVHGLGMRASFTASPVIPVSLSGFDITLKQGNPYLKWVTQSESNVDYFSVQRSYDGTRFSEISRVPAVGNSSTEQRYTFIDARWNKNTKYVYYELAITDIDGKVQLSPIQRFRNNLSTNKIITYISPNPVSSEGHMMIQFNADSPGSLLAQISDMNGRLVLTTELSASEGVNNGHIHLSGLSAGIYAVRFVLNGITETYKIRKR